MNNMEDRKFLFPNVPLIKYTCENIFCPLIVLFINAKVAINRDKTPKIMTQRII